MSNVEPNTNIWLYSGIDMDPEYRNTAFFFNTEFQWNWFNTKANLIKEFDRHSYQRWNAGSIRVAYPVDELISVNYMVFENASHSDKKFYAFVRNVQYVNERTTQIDYELDVMQTYMFDFILKECIVEREHTLTDEIGEHVQAEPVEIGRMVVNNITKSGWFEDYDVMVATAFGDS